MFVLNDVVSDGRVQRTAASAAAQGYEVLVIGVRSARAPVFERLEGASVIRVDKDAPVHSRADLERLAAQAVSAPSAPSPNVTSSPSPPAPIASAAGALRTAQSAYDEAVTFRLRRNRIYQVLNTYDKRLRRAVRRAFTRTSQAPLPPVAVPLRRRLDALDTWERTGRHMGDHDLIEHDQFRLGDVMVAQALAFEPDLCHCNDLDTLLAGARVKHMRAGACALVYDAHELWTEQHAPRRAREEHTDDFYAFYDDLLCALAPNVDAAITVNPSIAAVLESRTPEMAVEVVWNCPRRVDGALSREGPLRQRAGDRAIVLMHGGLIPMDRGLSELLEAAVDMEGALLVFRGQGAARPALEERARALGLLDTRVVFDDMVALADVVTRGAEADIGVIPYKPTGINNLLCSPNKLFEYMMSGLAVAASDLPELRRVVTQEDAGVLFNPTRPASIAAAINTLTRDPARLETCRQNARRAALSRYCWETQSQTLREVYARALRAAGARSTS